MSLREIRTEDEVFTAEGTVGVGAIREVHPDYLVAYFEGYGTHRLHAEDIRAAHDGKVIVDPERLPDDLRDRLPHIHDGEMRRPSQS